MSHEFPARYLARVMRSLPNNYRDNFDHVRFGHEPAAKPWFIIAKSALKRCFLPRASFDDSQPDSPTLAEINRLYDSLCDSASKELLVSLLAFRTLGHRKIRLPLSTPEYWKEIGRIEKLSEDSEKLDVNFMDWKLEKIDLEAFNFPLKLYGLAKNIFTQFILEQYCCKSGNDVIKAELGDTVIDAGGCWGDTALYFACETGTKGRVYSFEFIPSNLQIFSKNLEMNSAVRNRIKIVEKAMWSGSGTDFYYSDKGPASRVDLVAQHDSSGSVSSMSIDDFVDTHSIDQVDFIKMDIEGAELDALRGAESTIRKFSPKLAISVYHKFSHLVDIPRFIQDLDMGYEIYLRHFTIHHEETILFARLKALRNDV